MKNHPAPIGSHVPVTRQHSMWFVILISCAAGLGGLLYGYDTAVISGAIGFLKDLYRLSPFMEGLVISSIMIGGVFGVGISGFLSDRFGRRKILMAAALLFAVSAVVSALSQSVSSLIIARIIGGLGIGMGSSLSVTYITEAAPPPIRGSLSSLYQLFTILGISGTYFINLAVQQSGSYEWGVHTGWRWMLAYGMIPSVIFFIVLFLVPESPRWLAKAGRRNEALAVLTRINGEQTAKEEIKQIETSLQLEKMGSLSQLFKPGLRKALVIGILLALFNQVIGMNAITYYGPEIFKMMGFGQNAGFVTTCIVGVVEVIFTVIAVLLVDKVGRKKLMGVGSAFMALFMILIGASFYFHLASGTALVVIILGFVAAFCVSVGPITWIMISEIFPNHLRARAAGIATIFLWGANWAIGQFVPMMISGLGLAYTFWIFAVINILCFLFVVTICPETKNKSLEEIEKLWIK
ncbi:MULTISPECIES: sugar porter family MFS transporter [Bacillus amyloliquefaciens group]|uniref:sugar porter family MFS transporter n=1 Tax=Bacillus amyloliquefaciens group TaxID=1938374 RepID=UPI0002059525|nr:sugar porter family MFS transporter [Bacillus amyloliquefaciens]AIW35258.1 MFS transporter [Bacillus subtilis]AEB25611.1 AraE family aromatic acid exporter [Bacillus amyloliquefaciens TA208]MEC1831117.1 sugar porter family MFS transporter [Bacillus amyloliquefaciens]MEC1834779.1 sugar porter family MFS transporter [Bacillus amyloliquefaciens]MEC1842377.1 sugar porter family MFS transporter [Bacillus amyloliquefaciens]